MNIKNYYSVCKKSFTTKKLIFHENEKYFCEEEVDLGLIVVSNEKILNDGAEGYYFFKDEFVEYFYSEQELRLKKIDDLNESSL